jgi:hypothetical protein
MFFTEAISSLEEKSKLKYQIDKAKTITVKANINLKLLIYKAVTILFLCLLLITPVRAKGGSIPTYAENGMAVSSSF